MKTTPCIFNENELIIQQDNTKEYGYAKKLENWDINKQFFVINPIMGLGFRRCKENVSTMKNFLFEFDSIPLENQKTIFKNNKDIISMAAYSGNKSIHFIIQVVDVPTALEEYRYLWNMLKDKYFPLADKQCNDCVRLSRTPESFRKDTGKKQILIWNTLQPLNIKWRASYNVSNEIKNMSREYRKAVPITRNENLTYNAECVLKGDYPPKERDEIIRNGECWLYHHGYTLEEVLKNNMNQRANPTTIKNYWDFLIEVNGGKK